MEKIFQVFVSSTFEDLQEERKEVMQALLELTACQQEWNCSLHPMRINGL